ncbi:MAG: hypothetical protein NTU44_17595, partial [Bacteroidetes bacterium]|nr:hypothetical protein [Bacteroidota bacterium]
AVSGSNIKDSMLGATVGLGIDILSFSLDVRYEYGWENIYKRRAGEPNIDWKHEMFTVCLGFKVL